MEMLTAQSLEPKLYANAPVGVNVLFMGYGRTQGAIPENTSLGLEDPNLKINSVFLAYGRSFDLFGNNAKVDVILSTSSLTGTAKVSGTPSSREVNGMGDTKVRFTYNLFGAPSLSIKNFASYEQDLIVGCSIQATIPTGQYNASKLINIGTNRWALKPAIGISKKVGNYTFEFAADAEFYTVNNDFFGATKRKQEAIYSTQAHLLYTFNSAMWLAVGLTYYWGGDYVNNGVSANSKLRNTRIGVTLAYPIDKQNSIKIYGSSGVDTQYGTDFDAISIAWQHSWAD
jgi:hypothetical protein